MAPQIAQSLLSRANGELRRQKDTGGGEYLDRHGGGVAESHLGEVLLYKLLEHGRSLGEKRWSGSFLRWGLGSTRRSRVSLPHLHAFSFG